MKKTFFEGLIKGLACGAFAALSLLHVIMNDEDY